MSDSSVSQSRSPCDREEAKKKFTDVEYDFDYEIISHQMGELEDSNLRIIVEDIELIESETEESDND